MNVSEGGVKNQKWTLPFDTKEMKWERREKRKKREKRGRKRLQKNPLTQISFHSFLHKLSTQMIRNDEDGESSERKRKNKEKKRERKKKEYGKRNVVTWLVF